MHPPSEWHPMIFRRFERLSDLILQDPSNS